MPPLPSYNSRPMKKPDAQRSGAAAGLRELAESMADRMSVRAGRLSVKPDAGLEKPQLKVLGRE